MEQSYWLRDPLGRVENFFFVTPEVAAAILDDVPPGYTLTDVPPEPAPVVLVPASVTNFQARAALLQVPAGEGSTLFQVIDDALRAAKDTPDGRIPWQAWEQANDFFRAGALVNTLGAQFGLDSAQIDDLFRAAVLIEA